ncbi:MAG: TonB-dependent receptor [Gammaproteobacteria bacterium]|nr:TonB-dependent receptor [Gammaproteobacteria bacterium]MDH4312589.1 TonB-dependent receptor [Gammaproteobacteria bacterium]
MRIRHLLTPATRASGSIAGAVTAALAMGAPLPALGQQAGASSGIEEIVVTAQRREENLQDVGIAVTALGGEMLTDLNITTATDITRAVPSLKMNAYSSSQVVFNIRGVSQNDYGDQQEPPVAVYQDDSYASSINVASFPIFDLARVEVLRGPQGTLFGRNATGGAIQFVSNKPTRDFEGYATATVGSYGQFIVEGALSGPLADNFQARIAAISNTDDGYMESVVAGVPDRGGNDHYAVRGQLAWQPSETTDLNLIVRYMKANKETQAGIYSQEPACPNDQFQGEFTRPDQSCAFWVTGPGEGGTGYRNDAITPSRGGDPWKTAETQRSYVDREITGATLHFDWDIGELHLVSITDYQDATKFYLEGGDASPVDGVLFYQGSDLEQYSQEFRLSGEIGANFWVAGLYGMKVDGDYTGKFATPFYGYDPTIEMSQKTTSYAVFAQDEWQFADAWKLIVGARYWSDEREGTYFGTAPEVPGLSAPVTIIFNQNEVSPTGGSITPADAKNSFDGVTARVQLDWKPSDDLLLYGSFNRGSKSGGYTFSTGTPYDPDGSLTIPRAFLEGMPFDEETLDAFELGAKTTLGDSTTLNVAAFYYDYSDYQAFAQFGPVQTVINLDAETTGLEAELTSRPIEGLTLQVGASFLDSKVKDVPLPDGVTIEDHDLPQAPNFSGNALARYEFGLAGGTFGIQGDVQYSSEFCFTVLCAPVEQEDAYTVANLRLSYDSGDGRWGVAAFVDNLFEEEYRVYAFDSSLFAGVVAGVYARPRWYGLSATYRFGAL